MVQYFPVVTGSLTVTGSILVSGGITASGGISISGSVASATSASYALTASSADAFLVRNTLTAQTLVVQTITSSVDYVTGSTRFGSLLANTHVFTGSMSVSGSGTFASSITAGDVITTSYGTARIQITSTTNSANSGLRFSAKDSTGTAKNAGLYYVAGTTTANTFMSIAADDNNYQFNVLANGNVGIGTSSPTNALHISGSGGNTQTLVLEGSPSSANAYVVVKSASKMYFSGLSSDQSNNFIIYDGTANTTRLAITSGGNVGIGTTSPATKLHVSGPIGYGGSTYPQNVKLVKSGSTSVVFTMVIPYANNWNPAFATIRVAGSRTGLEEQYAAMYLLRLTYYGGAGMSSAVYFINGSDAVTISVSGNTSNPQTVTITITDAGSSTDYLIADLDISVNGGIISIS